LLRRFLLRSEGPASLLYDREQHTYLAVSEVECFLLEAARDVPLDVAIRMVSGFVTERDLPQQVAALRRLGALDDAGQFDGDIVKLAPVEGGFGAPLVCHLGLTLACNYACAHCYSSSGKRADDELTLDEIEDLADQLRAMGCMKLVFGGGEPLVRRDLPDAVRVAKARGLSVYVHTNGSLADDERVRALADDPPTSLALSLDGATPDTNDAVRGDGTFERSLEGARKLAAAYPPGFTINMTVTAKNAHDVAPMVDLAKDLGAKLLLLRPAYPAGNALDSALAVDRDTFAAAVDTARARADVVGLDLDAPHPDRAQPPDFPGFGCVAARVVLGVTPSGRVSPCLNLPREYEDGSVRDRPLLETWRASSAFTRVRGVEPNAQCASCKHYDTCRGGCRVRALNAHGALDAPDSWCHYEPEDEPVEYRPRGLRVVQ
jgi:radical SAM protein with 4Fe4S-binding SPASM domain